MVKNIILTLIMLFTVSLTTGCGTDSRVTAFLDTDLVTVIASRVEANKDMVNKLYSAGLLRTDEKDNIIRTIDTNMGAYTRNISGNRALQNKLLNAIVDWSAPRWEDYGPIRNVNVTGTNGEVVEVRRENRFGLTESEWNETIITTYISRNTNIASRLDLPLFKGSVVTPINIIDGQTGEEINRRFGYDVYVLKPFDEIQNISGLGLDGVMQNIRQAIEDRNFSILENYFKRAVDENNNSVTLLDIAQRRNQIFVNSSGSNLVSAENRVTSQINVNNTSFNSSLSTPSPGTDMVIRDRTTDLPIMAVRLYEFNTEGIKNIISKLGMNPNQYLFTTAKEGHANRVYIMEYPVHKVSGIKNNTENEDEFIFEFSKSNIGINLKTGRLIKYGRAWGDESAPGVHFEDSEPYLTLDGAKGPREESMSSFVIGGETPDNYRMKLGENRSKVRTGRIILRDYLEATYAPGVVENETMVVFGRKLRILNFRGNKNSVVARFYDMQGSVLERSANIMIDHFADFAALNSSNPSIRYIGRTGEALSEEELPNLEGIDSYTTRNIRDSLAKIDSLPKFVVNEINPTTPFPGPYIGASDMDNTNKPLFYAIAIRKNMFDTGMFSGWINNTNVEENSLAWWSRWLSDGRRNYNYRINKLTLEEYLMGNYTFELQREGILVLDLRTISKIQREFEQLDRENNVRWFRTTFVVLGYLLISYSFLLLLAWTVDTNVDLNLKILERLSFGNWIAVKDVDEITYGNTEGKLYIAFQPLVSKALGISIVGVILILVNVADVVIYLIEIFGGISRIIGGLITGI